MACTSNFEIEKLLENADLPTENPNPSHKTIIAPKISKLNVTLNSPGSTTLSWQKEDNGSTILGYRVKYAVGTTAPTNCESPDIDENSLTTDSINLTDLDYGSTYSFRVCSVTEDEVSTGQTLTVITLPNCDFTVTDGSLDNGTAGGLGFPNTADGVDSYVEFNAFLGAANTAGDQNLDGIISICLGNNLTVVTSTTYGSEQTEVAYDNMFIYANSSDTVTFDDQRTGYAGKPAFIVSGNNFSIANINFNSTSQEASFVVLGSVHHLSGINITSTANPGAPEGEIYASLGTIEYLNDVTIDTNCSRGAIYTLSGNIDNISNVNITGDPEHGIYFRFSGVAHITNIRDVELLGINQGITLQDTNTSTLKNIKIVNSSTTYSHGILLMDTSDIEITNLNYESPSGAQYAKGIRSINSNNTNIQLKNVNLKVHSPDSVGINLLSGEISSLTNSSIEVSGDGSFGIFIDDGSLLAMQDTTIKRNSSSTSTNNAAIAFQDDGIGFVDTTEIKNNVICSDSASTDSWSYLLGVYGNVSTVIDSEYTTATTAYNTSNSGIETFPWGDSDTSTNPNFNLQTQWGGTCP